MAFSRHRGTTCSPSPAWMADPTLRQPGPGGPPPQPGRGAPAVTGNRPRHRPACQARAGSPVCQMRAAIVRNATRCLCRSGSTPGSAVPAAGPPGTGAPGDPAVEASVLTWSVTAMNEATERRQDPTPEPATTWPPSPSRNRTGQSQPRFIASRQRQLLRLATAPITHYSTPLTSAQRNMITTQNGGNVRLTPGEGRLHGVRVSDPPMACLPLGRNDWPLCQERRIHLHLSGRARLSRSHQPTADGAVSAPADEAAR